MTQDRIAQADLDWWVGLAPRSIGHSRAILDAGVAVHPAPAPEPMTQVAGLGVGQGRA